MRDGPAPLTSPISLHMAVMETRMTRKTIPHSQLVIPSEKGFFLANLFVLRRENNGSADERDTDGGMLIFPQFFILHTLVVREGKKACDNRQQSGLTLSLPQPFVLASTIAGTQTCSCPPNVFSGNFFALLLSAKRQLSVVI